MSSGTIDSSALYATAPASSSPWFALKALSAWRKNRPGWASGALMPPPGALLDAAHARRRVHALDGEEEGAHGPATQRHLGVLAVRRARAVVDDLPYLSVGERDGALGPPALEAPGDVAFDCRQLLGLRAVFESEPRKERRRGGCGSRRRRGSRRRGGRRRRSGDGSARRGGRGEGQAVVAREALRTVGHR